MREKSYCVFGKETDNLTPRLGHPGGCSLDESFRGRLQTFFASLAPCRILFWLLLHVLLQGLPARRNSISSALFELVIFIRFFLLFFGGGIGNQYTYLATWLKLPWSFSLFLSPRSCLPVVSCVERRRFWISFGFGCLGGKGDEEKGAITLQKYS